MGSNFAEVAPAVPLSPTGPQTYTYRLPAHPANPVTNYTIVTIPFGSRLVTGVVTRLHRQRPLVKTKLIRSVSPLALTDQQVAFARWLANTMHGGLGYTLRLFLPPRLTCPRPVIYRSPLVNRPDRRLLTALTHGQAAIIDYQLKHRSALVTPVISHFTRQHLAVLTIVPEKKLLSGPGLAYHAGLRPSAITAIWHGVKMGHINTIRGTQKALFLPWQRLGLIIIEEEQNPAHKLWDQYPRLSNIDAIQLLSRLYHCPLLYLSSFPSWRLGAMVDSKKIMAPVNRPLSLKTNRVLYTFADQRQHYPLPHQLLLKLRAWSRAQKRTLLLYNRLDNRKILPALQANLSPSQLSFCLLATSRVFSRAAEPFDRTVWLFPEQTINFPDYRSLERAHVTVARLQQLSRLNNSPVYLVTRQPHLLEQVFKDPAAARQQDLKLRQRFLLPPFAYQVRLRISASTPHRTRRKSEQILALLKDKIAQLPPPQASPLLMRGPYSPLSQTDALCQHFIILRGPLDRLPALYADLPINGADLSPHQVL